MMSLLSSILSCPRPSLRACILMMVSWSRASSNLALFTSSSSSALLSSALDSASPGAATDSVTHRCTGTGSRSDYFVLKNMLKFDISTVANVTIKDIERATILYIIHNNFFLVLLNLISTRLSINNIFNW